MLDPLFFKEINIKVNEKYRTVVRLTLIHKVIIVKNNCLFNDAQFFLKCIEIMGGI